MVFSRYRSQFGGLWTDLDNAKEKILAKLECKDISIEEAEQLNFWFDNGYIIIKNAVSEEILDRLDSEIENSWKHPNESLKIEIYGDIFPLSPSLRNRPFKLLDFYAFSDCALQAIFANKIVRFLQLIFESQPLAFQSLSFEHGTEQAVHQDTAYVVVSSPMRLVASWIALEDIQEGSGELEYYEGSHRLEEFLFSGKYKHWNPKRDGQKAHTQYLQLLHSKSEEMNLKRKKFHAKKGDVLIWSADLAHGGSKINNSGISRKSLVTHYCPNNVQPHYFSYLPRHRHKMKFNDCEYSSSHYQLSKMPMDLKIREIFGWLKNAPLNLVKYR